MRNSMLGCSFFFAAAMIGCGGDDDGGMITPMPDAKVFMDAGVDSAPLCGTMSAALYRSATRLFVTSMKP